ncbi:MAG: hypothetical protein F6J93_07415 [Oscillatoria sp. SIO1A7]|nr:hypothetical protein [Oscillatoria sp. SIO1A7]
MTANSFQPKPEPENQKEDFPRLVCEEQMRQAKIAFNLAVVAMSFNIATSAFGLGLLLAGRVSEGTASTASGMIPITAALGLAVRADNALERAAKETCRE